MQKGGFCAPLLSIKRTFHIAVNQSLPIKADNSLKAGSVPEAPTFPTHRVPAPFPSLTQSESFYNKEMGAKFNRYYLFIANYNSRQPSIDGRGKCNIWQYSETGHLYGIGERVDLSRFMNGTTIKDLML